MPISSLETCRKGKVPIEMRIVLSAIRSYKIYVACKPVCPAIASIDRPGAHASYKTLQMPFMLTTE